MSAATGEIKISDGGVRIAKGNALRFVRTDNQSGTEQTLDNRLLTDMVIPNTSDDWNFFQKFDNTGAGDQINTQIATIHTIDSFKTYNFLTDAEVESIALPSPSYTIVDATYGTVNFYDFNIDCSGYGGYYYVIATINTTQLYRCEPFYVFDFTNSDGVLIKCYNETNSDYNDGIDYTASPINLMRLDARFVPAPPGQIKTVFTSFLGKKVNLKGQPLRFMSLQLGGVPWWIIEKLNIAIQHDTFTINNESFTTDEDLESTNIKQGEIATYIYTGSIQFQQDNFEDYEELTVAPATISDGIKWGDGSEDELKYSDDDEDIITHKD